MTLPRFEWNSVVAWMRNINVPENYCYYLWLFLHVALSHIPTLRVLQVHLNGIRSINIHITEAKIHISFSEIHDSTLFFYYVYMSPLPTLAHTIAKGSTFSISSPFDVTKLQRKIVLVSQQLAAFRFQCQWTRILIFPHHFYCDGDSTLV